MRLPEHRLWCYFTSVSILKEDTISRNISILFVVVSAIFWSTAGLFIKIIELGPFSIAGIRAAIASLVMIALMNKNIRFNWSIPQIGGAIAYTATGITFVAATKLTTAANAVLLQYTMPAFTAVLGIWLLKEKVSRFDWFIVSVVVFGMGLFFLEKISFYGFWGNVLAITSAVTFAFAVIFMRMQKSASPVETSILSNILTAVVCLPFIIQQPPNSTDWWPLLYLGIFQVSIPFFLYSIAIKYIKALDAALVQMVVPLLNPIWVFLVIGETPGVWAVIGGVIVLTSVTLRNIYYGSKKVPKLVVVE